MIVSHNELVAAVNKAFLGMRRTCGEADVIANMVADLQMVGLDGVRHFNNASNFIGLEDDCPVDIQVTSGNTVEVDLHKASLACHLPVVMDYAIEKMVGKKTLKIELNNCHNRWLAYSELVKLAAKGIACTARWDNGSNPKSTLYVLNRGCVAPELFLSDLPLTSDEHIHNMTIELSVQDFDIERLSDGYQTHVTSESLFKTQENAWRDGIEVNDAEWATLKETATAILVENSQRSIQGAGELVAS
ncbi:conserved hypothetical protein [Vibrio chagasii]|uniref:DUF3726 domain-containing protein n=1 Tax=Vibrio TaxID=662 RepID=UPI000CF3D8AF|nr:MULTISPECIES: DUF3726 domain-containing protein [Vibrio]CAH7078939.1 conserved hypothetical protein [Vibrio chagasii]NOI95129.1 DUF3726 domain-containing protein [Vibrio sp. T3Y01]PQJ50797.1 hypothetical protein BTO12_12690 [Vibrio splendidus]CAH7082801.1 conserved hypothetical protein [Vibrio chagasii]CAH7315516.1 conserved hypothetical protein [Vibrio chagasii]